MEREGEREGKTEEQTSETRRRKGGRVRKDGSGTGQAG